MKELIELDVEMISEELYQMILKEFKKCKDNVTYVDEWKISAMVEYDDE